MHAWECGTVRLSFSSFWFINFPILMFDFWSFVQIVRVLLKEIWECSLESFFFEQFILRRVFVSLEAPLELIIFFGVIPLHLNRLLDHTIITLINSLQQLHPFGYLIFNSFGFGSAVHAHTRYRLRLFENLFIRIKLTLYNLLLSFKLRNRRLLLFIQCCCSSKTTFLYIICLPHFCLFLLISFFKKSK